MAVEQVYLGRFWAKIQGSSLCWQHKAQTGEQT